LEIAFAVGLGGQAAVGAVDDFRAVARLDDRARDIAGRGNLVGDAGMTRAVGRPANIGGGIGFTDSPGEVLGAGWPELGNRFG
jgi:hypothetical protein